MIFFFFFSAYLDFVQWLQIPLEFRKRKKDFTCLTFDVLCWISITSRMGIKQVHSTQVQTKETTFAAAYRLCSDSTEDLAFMYMHACVCSSHWGGGRSHQAVWGCVTWRTLSLPSGHLVPEPGWFGPELPQGLGDIFSYTHTSILKLTPSCKAGKGVRLLAWSPVCSHREWLESCWTYFRLCGPWVQAGSWYQGWAESIQKHLRFSLPDRQGSCSESPRYSDEGSSGPWTVPKRAWSLPGLRSLGAWVLQALTYLFDAESLSCTCL